MFGTFTLLQGKSQNDRHFVMYTINTWDYWEIIRINLFRFFYRCLFVSLFTLVCLVVFLFVCLLTLLLWLYPGLALGLTYVKWFASRHDNVQKTRLVTIFIGRSLKNFNCDIPKWGQLRVNSARHLFPRLHLKHHFCSRQETDCLALICHPPFWGKLCYWCHWSLHYLD